MTDEQTNGMGLDPEYAKAHEYSTLVRLRQEQELRDARQENEELRVNLAEAQAKLDGMLKLNEMYQDQLQVAITDRKLAMDKLAVLAVRFDVLRKCLDPVQDATP